jgi:23S rRNA-/tRNA-specific pseudouridylate synthase
MKIVVHEPPPRRTDWTVALETDDVIVVEKPSGLPSQATRDAGGALDEQVIARWPDARLHHRLDRETSGLVLFTRTAAARKTLEGQLVREYLAIVAGRFEGSRKIEAHLGEDPDDPRKQKVGPGKPADTMVSAERIRGDRTLVRARLGTGRTHQVRVHLAHIGLPILGDPLYAPSEVAAAAPRLALHACRLAWPGGQVVSPLPAELEALIA